MESLQAASIIRKGYLNVIVLYRAWPEVYSANQIATFLYHQIAQSFDRYTTHQLSYQVLRNVDLRPATNRGTCHHLDDA